MNTWKAVNARYQDYSAYSRLLLFTHSFFFRIAVSARTGSLPVISSFRVTYFRTLHCLPLSEWVASQVNSRYVITLHFLKRAWLTTSTLFVAACLHWYQNIAFKLQLSAASRSYLLHTAWLGLYPAGLLRIVVQTDIRLLLLLWKCVSTTSTTMCFCMTDEYKIIVMSDCDTHTSYNTRTHTLYMACSWDFQPNTSNWVLSDCE